MRQFHSDFYYFFNFLDRIIFLIVFLNPFTAHSRPRFLFELNFRFSLVFFLFTCGILTLFFFVFFFLFFDLIFLNGFLNSLVVHSRSSFLVNENSLNCTSGLVLLCFFYFVE